MIKPLERQQNNYIGKCLLVNISIEASSADPDQTAPTGAVWSGSALFVDEASNILAEDKSKQFFDDMRSKG